MEKNEFRAVIKYLHMKGLMPKEIKAELNNIHSISALAHATVYNWLNKFKRGRTSTCNAPRSGRPIKAATPEIIDKVHDIVLTDRRMKVCEATGTSHGTVISILHEQLSMKKLDAARKSWVPQEKAGCRKKKLGATKKSWVPCLLTVDHKRDRVISKQCWRCFNVIQMNFCVDLL